MPEFYIGYLPSAPAGLARKLRRTVVGIGVAGVVIAVALVLGQQPFPASSFEYGTTRSFDGVVSESPYPRLSNYLLVGPGKHGADSLVRGFDGRRVRLQGTLISRDNQMLIEVVPGSLQPQEQSEVGRAVRLPSIVHLKGEIVDSKCYFGVMNPGSGTVHRECARRCISGGIPPSFIVRDATGRVRTMLLTGPGGSALRKEILHLVAKPVEISGTLLRSGDMLVLQTDLSSIRE